MISVHVRVSGRVQGVYYRAFTRDKAMELGVKGWVRNHSRRWSGGGAGRREEERWESCSS